MTDIARGIISGGVASAAVGGAILLASAVGLVDARDPIRTAAGLLLSPVGLSWVVHFAVGTIGSGSIYAILMARMPGPVMLKGLIFGALAWLVTMLLTAVEQAIQLQFELRPLVVHLLFGTVLAATYRSVIGDR